MSQYLMKSIGSMKVKTSIDPEQLQMGIKVEMEHTNDPAIAEKIARDHLAEIKDYYSRLKKMESSVLKKSILFFGRLIKSQLGLFDKHQTGETKGKLILKPSKTDPNIRRWQKENIENVYKDSGISPDKIMRAKLDDGHYVYHPHAEGTASGKPSYRYKTINEQFGRKTIERTKQNINSDFIDDYDTELSLFTNIQSARIRAGLPRLTSEAWHDILNRNDPDLTLVKAKENAGESKHMEIMTGHETRPLINPHASAMVQDKQLRAQQKWDKEHKPKTVNKPNEQYSIPRIKAPALKIDNKIIEGHPRGTHSMIYDQLPADEKKKFEESNDPNSEGYIDNDGKYLTRNETKKIYGEDETVKLRSKSKFTDQPESKDSDEARYMQRADLKKSLEGYGSKKMKYPNIWIRLLKSQLGLFSESEALALVTKEEHSTGETKGKLILMPTKSKPSIRRWQDTTPDESKKEKPILPMKTNGEKVKKVVPPEMMTREEFINSAKFRKDFIESVKNPPLSAPNTFERTSGILGLTEKRIQDAGESIHKIEVEKALKEGKPIYEGWQKDYPDLSVIFSQEKPEYTKTDNGGDAVQIGDRIFIYSNGWNEITDFKGKNVEDENLIQLLDKTAKEGRQKAKEKVMEPKPPEITGIKQAREDIEKAKELMAKAPENADPMSSIKTKSDYQKYINETQDWIDQKDDINTEIADKLKENKIGEEPSEKSVEQKLIEDTGKNQKQLLSELFASGELSYNPETKQFGRGGLSTKTAKELLLPEDKTIDEQISELQPMVIQLETDAKKLGVELNNTARQKLNDLLEKKRFIEQEIVRYPELIQHHKSVFQYLPQVDAPTNKAVNAGADSTYEEATAKWDEYNRINTEMKARIDKGESIQTIEGLQTNQSNREFVEGFISRQKNEAWHAYTPQELNVELEKLKPQGDVQIIV